MFFQFYLLNFNDVHLLHKKRNIQNLFSQIWRNSVETEGILNEKTIILCGVFAMIMKMRRFLMHRKTCVLESVFDKIAGLKAWNFIKKRLQQRCFPIIDFAIATSFWADHSFIILKYILIERVFTLLFYVWQERGKRGGVHFISHLLLYQSF